MDRSRKFQTNRPARYRDVAKAAFAYDVDGHVQGAKTAHDAEAAMMKRVRARF
jgi:hypothetical protein